MVADKSCKTGAGQKVKKAESIPDDASFVASLKERQKESEVTLKHWMIVFVMWGSVRFTLKLFGFYTFYAFNGQFLL